MNFLIKFPFRPRTQSVVKVAITLTLVMHLISAYAYGLSKIRESDPFGRPEIIQESVSLVQVVLVVYPVKPNKCFST